MRYSKKSFNVLDITFMLRPLHLYYCANTNFRFLFISKTNLLKFRLNSETVTCFSVQFALIVILLIVSKESISKWSLKHVIVETMVPYKPYPPWCNLFFSARKYRRSQAKDLYTKNNLMEMSHDKTMLSFRQISVTS